MAGQATDVAATLCEVHAYVSVYFMRAEQSRLL
jgi:hypothetical protein